MYINSGYLHQSLVDFQDKSRPLIVGSCGTYHLYTRPKLPTWRPKGRLDYQLLYLAAGKVHFFLDGKEEIVTAGHMVLYRPKEMQRYVYYGEDQTEVYWVHFTGSDVKRLLREYGLPSSGHVFYTGNSPDYHQLFRRMILELQLCKPHYEEYLSMLLREIFLLAGRQLAETHRLNPTLCAEMEQATRYFNEHFHEDISIDNYAAQKHMSTCWFIRSFKQFNGATPMQYILSVRIANAKNLLDTTTYNVTEIASIVGYENPLYFSRLFHKQTGVSPSEYRKRSNVSPVRSPNAETKHSDM